MARYLTLGKTIAAIFCVASSIAKAEIVYCELENYDGSKTRIAVRSPAHYSANLTLRDYESGELQLATAAPIAIGDIEFWDGKHGWTKPLIITAKRTEQQPLTGITFSEDIVTTVQIQSDRGSVMLHTTGYEASRVTTGTCYHWRS